MRRFTATGRLVLGALVASAGMGLDTNQTLAYQAFTLFLSLMALSLVSSLFFRSALKARRKLPRFGTVGEGLTYRVILGNHTPKEQKGLVLMENLQDPRPSLRDYRPGDPLRHVHWRSWAKVGVPIVKEFHDEFFVRHALILDTFQKTRRDDLFEEAVSIAASFVCEIQSRESLLDLMFAGTETYCFTSGRGIGGMDRMLEILASVSACTDRPFRLLAAQVFQIANTSPWPPPCCCGQRDFPHGMPRGIPFRNSADGKNASLFGKDMPMPGPVFTATVVGMTLMRRRPPGWTWRGKTPPFSNPFLTSCPGGVSKSPNGDGMVAEA